MDDIKQIDGRIKFKNYTDLTKALSILESNKHIQEGYFECGLPVCIEGRTLIIPSGEYRELYKIIPSLLDFAESYDISVSLV